MTENMNSCEIIESEDNSMILMKPLGASDAEPTGKEIFNAIVNLSNSHNKLSCDVKKFQLETSEFIKKNKLNIEMIPQIANDQKQLIEKVNNMEKRFDFVQQRSNMKNLIISGIPKVSSELLPRLFGKVVKILLGPTEVVPVEFITVMKDKSGKFNAILVGLLTLKDKEKLMKMKKAKGDLFLEELGFDITKMNNSPVYLSDHLIGSVFALLREARKLKQNGYQFVWCRGCTIFVQKDKDSLKYTVNCTEDLYKVPK